MQKIKLMAGNVLGFTVFFIGISIVWLGKKWKDLQPIEIKPWELNGKGEEYL